jgi:small-conductance mechanosensitive channel
MAETTPTPEQTVKPVHDGLGFSDFLKVGRDALTTQEAETAAPVEGGGKPAESKSATPTDDTKATTPKAGEKPEESKATDETDVHLAATKQKLKQHQRWNTQLSQQNAQLKRDLTDVNKKLDVLDKKLSGTYEEGGPKSEEEQKRDLDEREQKARMEEKAKISFALLVKEIGKEEAQKSFLDDDAPWRRCEEDPAIMSRVWAADSPYHEAQKILKEEELFEKFGTRDVAELLAKDREQTKAQLKQEILAELKGESTPKESKKAPPTLGTARGGANTEPRSRTEQKSLSALMPHLS